MEKGEIIAISTKDKTVITPYKKFLAFKKIIKGKKPVHKKVMEITEQRALALRYKLMGIAEGLNLLHCIYLASKYTKNFKERVIAYSIITPTNKKHPYAVAFYERKSNR